MFGETGEEEYTKWAKEFGDACSRKKTRLQFGVFFLPWEVIHGPFKNTGGGISAGSERSFHRCTR